MICAEWVIPPGGASSAPVLGPVINPPADLSACAAVVLHGTDVGALQLFTFPSAADAGTAFVWGFSMVVGSFAFAWGCGAVLNMFKR